MRKIKTILFSILCVFSLTCIAFFGACVGACGEDSDKAQETISELELEQGVLSWKKISGIKQYSVTVNGANGQTVNTPAADVSPYITTDGEFLLEVEGESDTIIAKGAIKVNAQKLPVPTVTVKTNADGEKYFSWTEISNAIGYNYKLNGSTEIFTEETIVLPVKSGSYSIEVRAIGVITGTEFYVSGDYSSKSEELSVNDRVILSFNRELGTVSFETIAGASRYALFVNDNELVSDFKSGTSIYGKGLITETSELVLTVKSYDKEDNFISTSLPLTAYTKILNTNEVFTFDNKDGFNINSSSNVTISYQTEIKTGDKGYAAKLVSGNESYYAGFMFTNLLGLDTEGVTMLTYDIYVEKPQGYEGDTCPVKALPFAGEGAITTFTAVTADGSTGIPFEAWTKIYMPIDLRLVGRENFPVTWYLSKSIWGIEGSGDGPAFSSVTYYIDNIFLGDKTLENEDDYDFVYYPSNNEEGEKVKVATKLEGGKSVEVSFKANVGSTVYEGITGKGTWGRRAKIGGISYWFIDGDVEDHKGILPTENQDLTFKFATVLDANGNFELEFYDFKVVEYFAIKDLSVTEISDYAGTTVTAENGYGEDTTPFVTLDFGTTNANKTVAVSMDMMISVGTTPFAKIGENAEDFGFMYKTKELNGNISWAFRSAVKLDAIGQWKNIIVRLPLNEGGKVYLVAGKNVDAVRQFAIAFKNVEIIENQAILTTDNTGFSGWANYNISYEYDFGTENAGKKAIMEMTLLGYSYSTDAWIMSGASTENIGWGYRADITGIADGAEHTVTVEGIPVNASGKAYITVGACTSAGGGIIFALKSIDVVSMFDYISVTDEGGYGENAGSHVVLDFGSANANKKVDIKMKVLGGVLSDVEFGESEVGLLYVNPTTGNYSWLPDISSAVKAGTWTEVSFEGVLLDANGKLTVSAEKKSGSVKKFYIQMKDVQASLFYDVVSTGSGWADCVNAFEVNLGSEYAGQTVSLSVAFCGALSAEQDAWILIGGTKAEDSSWGYKSDITSYMDRSEHTVNVSNVTVNASGKIYIAVGKQTSSNAGVMKLGIKSVTVLPE